MPRGWDWAQWIALERNHFEPSKEDQELARRIGVMEKTIERQRRLAFLLYFELRVILVGLALLSLLIAFLAPRVSSGVLIAFSVFFILVLAAVLLLLHVKRPEMVTWPRK